MTTCFGPFRLDPAARELRRDDAIVPLEPQVFDLLRLLVEHTGRVVSREEIIEAVWGGRIVSDSAVSSRVKSLRRALGDDGEAQRWIRTAAKVGYGFVGAVDKPAGDGAAKERRPSLAVLPFAVIGAADALALTAADGVPHDLIVELSRLRWLRVIARGSAFRLRGAGAEQVRQALDAGFVLNGTVERLGGALSLTVELCDTESGSVVWGDRFRAVGPAVHEMREQIAAAVVGALELQIPLHEASRASLSSPESLDAWAAYHLALRSMYRFSREGAQEAAALFERAIALDPGFARAHAGLSFVSFQNAFLRFVPDVAAEGERTRRLAERSLELDPLDPFCNLVMGRAHWLAGDLDGAMPWLDRAVGLNPNYAQGRYSTAWTETLLGRGEAGRTGVDEALRLSPLDPLVYGMLGVRALSHMVSDEPENAAVWGERAARSPGAHALIVLIAAVGCSLAGEGERAAAWTRVALGRSQGLSAGRFFEAFPLREPAAQRRVAAALQRLGL